jgi:hypothetical protein
MAKGGKGIVYLVLSTLFMIVTGYVLYNISAFLYTFLPWSFVKVWMPVSFVYAVVSIFTAFLLFYLYFLALFFFPKGTAPAHLDKK